VITFLSVCLGVCVPSPLKQRIVEPEEKAVARQWLGKHFHMATNTHAQIKELLEAVFSMRPVSYQIIGSERNMSIPCGGGVECLHRSSASDRRRRKGKSRI
jgi:hypothetical protein